ncbi:MAG: ABC transporter ATP-binding protein [Candidatus Paceibacterota bacterium]
MEPIIEVRNISKKYKINHERGGYIALRDVMMNIIKQPLSYLKTKAKSVAGLEKKEDFWALKDVNFTVNKGEVIGIIGKNGAGKSTLLKILSQITPPTEGEIILRGKVGSLLEVGTGFHPELTGRENIFLNGAILGMTQKEIAKKFDQIVGFAGIEKFLDTPVKYYSSGMYVRLAFSVAAHMEPDILIIDEVLAVGDAEFQKKCLGKIEEVTHQDGRTIIFVSHNLDAIERLCTKTVLLKKGELIKFGKTSEVINYYLQSERTLDSITEYPINNNPEGQITRVVILDKDNQSQTQIPVGEKFFIEIELDVRKKLENKLIVLHFYYHGDLILVSTEGDANGKHRDYEVGKYKTRVEIPSSLFQIGNISVVISFKHFNEGKSGVDIVKDINFEITNKNNPRQAIFGDNHWGKIATILKYETQPITQNEK